MSSQSFKFQQFEVYHNQCAMKVGTDGVLLGAWVAQEYSSAMPIKILDIGTGSGLIALMIAQEFTESQITGIDIDRQAVMQAQGNFSISLWNNRLTAIQCDFQNYQPTQKFDIAVCNPPFFCNSLKNPDIARATARHNESLPFSLLISHTFNNLLVDNGILCVIIPFSEKDSLCNLAYNNGINLINYCNIRSYPGKPFKRILMAFSRQKVSLPTAAELTLETPQHTRSAEYSYLTRKYYL